MNAANTQAAPAIVLPKVGEHITFARAPGGVVTSVGKPLTSGRFVDMHVVCIDGDDGRPGTFIAETHHFTITRG